MVHRFRLAYVRLVLASILPTCCIVMSEAAPRTAEEAAAYTRVITERADKIVTTLGITDSAHATRVRDVLVRQYRSLGEIHDTLAAKLDEAKNSPASDPTLAKAWMATVRTQASLQLFDLHRYFVARLAVELTPEQIEKVKDGMTYNVVQVTYRRYLELLPDLSDEQRREVLANLIEAREHAMDAGSSEAKHALFGKFKGRINNDLSAAGYDLKQAEKDLAARQKRGPTSDVKQD